MAEKNKNVAVPSWLESYLDEDQKENMKAEKHAIPDKSSFDRDFAMLTYFQDEFKFRSTHYWSILIKMFVLTTIITILPIVSDAFGLSLNIIPSDVVFCFPALGLVLSCLSLFIILDEAKKIQAVNEAKYRINRNRMESSYHYHFYNPNIGKQTSNGKRKKTKWLAFKMPWIVFGTELLIIGTVIFFIMSSNMGQVIEQVVEQTTGI